MKCADAAMVTSGTATLETALFRVPMVVCYRGSDFSYEIAKRLIKIKYISLVNLILDKPVVKELIQHEMTAENITSELQKILSGNERKNMLNDFNTLIEMLGNKGASERAAEIVYDVIKRK